MPIFADYHRTVVGYHGTLRSTALDIVSGHRTFKFSQNKDDWLGHGVYFWEYAPQQAWRWAEERYKKHKRPLAVIGSMIRLGACLDLLDPNNASRLVVMHRQLLRAYDESGDSPPKNHNAKKYLDCATFEYAYTALEDGGSRSIRAARCTFRPGRRTGFGDGVGSITRRTSSCASETPRVYWGVGWCTPRRRSLKAQTKTKATRTPMSVRTKDAASRLSKSAAYRAEMLRKANLVKSK